jgi:hypothetical protein
MVVVKAPVKRYLWVDQWYVDQHDGAAKNLQLQEMDHVYAEANVTIVAGAGSDAAYELPGISRGRSIRQASATVSHMELYSSLPTLLCAIKDTVWNGRGWTYQETMLSRQC